MPKPRTFLAISFLLWLAMTSHLDAQQDIQRMRQLNPRMPEPLAIDLDRVSAMGIRLVSGKHIDLFTDVRDTPEIDELVKIFDAAIPLWCQYFKIDPAKTQDYRLSAFVFDQSQKEKFRQAGLLPPDAQHFPAGYNRGHEMWVFLQQDIYYTRHLLLHEGTHAFMQWYLGDSGPAWYSEGMAELLAVHRWNEGKLQIGYRVRSRLDCPGWGRVKLIRESCDADDLKSLDQVTSIPPNAFTLPRPIGYAWAWAACEFFSKHPMTREPFALFTKLAGNRNNFDRQFRRWLSSQDPEVIRDWELFCEEIEYGYEVARGAVSRAKPSDSDTGSFDIQSDLSWQDTGIEVEAGDELQISATGRFTVAQNQGESKDEVWPCEAGGITIEYYRGQPLGKLTAAVLVRGDDRPVIQTRPIGTGAKWLVPVGGTLCLRINESPAALADNQGSLTVQVKK